MSNPFLTQFYSKSQKNKYGSQLQLSSQMGYFGMPKIAYKNDQYVNQLDKSVTNFVADNGNLGKNYTVFKNLLSQRISIAQQQTSSYSLQQISKFYPWVFSSNVLFQPVRSILYYLKLGYSTPKKLTSANQLPGSLINNEAVQAVYQSIKYNKSYLQNVGQIFADQYVGWFTAGLRYVMGAVYKIAGLGASIGSGLVSAAKYLGQLATQGAKAFLNWIYNDGHALFVGGDLENIAKQTQEKEKPFVANVKTVMKGIVDLLFSSLKMYGSILINFSYLQACFKTKVIKGTIYYFSPATPNIYITCIQSFAKVFMVDSNGNLIQIPQNSFNIDFLRSLCRQQIIQSGANMVKTMVQQRTIPNKNLAPKKDFYNKYLKVKTKQGYFDAKVSNAYKTYQESNRTGNDEKTLKQQVKKIKQMYQQYKSNPTLKKWDEVRGWVQYQ